MRRLLAAASLLMCLACGSDFLAPVTAVDGSWSGIQNGYSMALAMIQSGTAVSGNASLGGVGGFADGTLVGTFIFPNLDVTISIPGADNFTYKGTMSQSDARITGQLNGSGFTNLEITVAKKQ